jgi:hypothetical protein
MGNGLGGPQVGIDIEIKNILRWYYDTIWIDINNSGGVLKQTVNFSRNINIQSKAD